MAHLDILHIDVMFCFDLYFFIMVSSIDMSLCFTVPISVVASFRKIREIVYDRSLLVAALRTSSELVNILINIVLTTTFRYHVLDKYHLILFFILACLHIYILLYVFAYSSNKVPLVRAKIWLSQNLSVGLKQSVILYYPMAESILSCPIVPTLKT